MSEETSGRMIEYTTTSTSAQMEVLGFATYARIQLETQTGTENSAIPLGLGGTERTRGTSTTLTTFTIRS